jgi:hypothetical protein
MSEKYRCFMALPVWEVTQPCWRLVLLFLALHGTWGAAQGQEVLSPYGQLDTKEGKADAVVGSHRLPGAFLDAAQMRFSGKPSLLIFYLLPETEENKAAVKNLPRVQMDLLQWESPTKPLQTAKRLLLWEDAVGFDLCRNAKGETQVLILRSQGIWDLITGSQVFAKDHLFSNGRAQGFARIPMCFSVQSLQDKSYLILPGITGYHVFWESLQQPGYREIGVIPFQAHQRLAQRFSAPFENRLNYQLFLQLPEIFVTAEAASPGVQFILLERTAMTVYTHEGQAAPIKQVAEQQVDFYQFIDKREQSNVQVISVLASWQGQPALYVCRLELSLMKPNSQISVYPLRDFRLSAKPAARWTSEQVALILEPSIPLDGSGTGGLLIGTVEAGFGTMFNYFLSRKVEVSFFDAETLLTAKSVEPLAAVQVGIETDGAIRAKGGKAFWGRFADSKSRYVVMPEDGENLTAYELQETTGRQGRRWWRVPISLGRNLYEVDLNSDGRPEYFLAYPGAKEDHLLKWIIPPWDR